MVSVHQITDPATVLLSLSIKLFSYSHLLFKGTMKQHRHLQLKGNIKIYVKKGRGIPEFMVQDIRSFHLSFEEKDNSSAFETRSGYKDTAHQNLGWVRTFGNSRAVSIYYISHLVPRDFSQVLVFLFAKYDLQKDENRCALKI